MFHNRYAQRRHALGLRIGEGCVALIPGNTTLLHNRDVEYPFKQDSDFFYLTGWREHDALLLIKGGEKPCGILFYQKNNKSTELFAGKSIGPKTAARIWGFNEAYGMADADLLYSKVMSITDHAAVVLCTSADTGPFASAVLGLGRNGGSHDIRYLIGEMRLIKDSHEIDIMRRACAVSGAAHRDILFLVKPGMYEYEVEAELTRSFRRAGGDPLHAYPSIVASGKNACTLHYTRNNAQLKDGELLLIDAGCELEGYASDITRTFPVSGLWNKPQRTLYEIVLRAQTEAIKCAKVGISIGYLDEVARKYIAEGLLRVGLITTRDPDDAILRGLDKKFFPHGTSHWLGLDVHDVGDYTRNKKTARAERLLTEGMILTVEPGLYVREAKGAKEYRDIGIRIEDDILITQSGPVVLSSTAPKDPDEIESIMQCGMT